MPFAPLRLPSIGLELLKASLGAGRASTLYLTIAWADRFGFDLYRRVLERPFTLVGEWLFAPALHETDPRDVDRFFRLLARHEPSSRVSTAADRRALVAARHASGAFLDDCVARILARGPRIVGLTSVFQQHVPALALARRLKSARPDLHVIVGGSNCDGVMGLETMRQFPFLDAVVSGEGDRVFPDLVRALLEGTPVDGIPGVYTRDRVDRLGEAARTSAPKVRDMDALPYPDYAEFFDQWRASAVGRRVAPRLLFETSRGCWWGEKQHCTFCGLNGETMAFRSKSASRALDELEWMIGRHAGLEVMVVDNILDMAYFRDLLPAMAERRLPTRIFFEVKANLRKDQVRLMKAAGITDIQPGVESLSGPILKLMRKGVTPLQNIQLLKWCAEIGVWAQWHFLWGFPGEPREEYARMARMLPLLAHLPPPRGAGPIRLDRFSPNFTSAGELGLVNVRPSPFYAHVYALPDEALANLAYFFVFDHRDGRNPWRYTAPLARRIVEWQSAYATSELFYIDRHEMTWVRDRRGGADELRLLTDLDRAVFHACDRVRSVAALPALVSTGVKARASARDVGRALDRLLGEGLLIRDGDQVLTLAVAGRAAAATGEALDESEGADAPGFLTVVPAAAR
jgi:ribosomal peptide maturation radical SAM protein 1